MSRAVMQQALEVQKRISLVDDDCDILSPSLCDALTESIAAIESALAQPEQEPFVWPTMPPSIGQSPVLFESGYDEGWAKCMSMCKAAYTSPQRQQLTTEQYTDLAHRIASTYAHRTDPTFVAYTFLPHTLEQFVRSIEDALQEKNA